LAKNLKLNIKNAQLAEALKLNQLKKPAAPKKSKKSDTDAVESKEVQSAEPSVVHENASPAPVVQAPQPPVVEKPQQAEKKSDETPVVNQPQTEYKKPYTPDTRYSRPHSDRGGYQSPSHGESRPPRYQNDRPGYQSNQSGDSRFQRPQGDRPYHGASSGEHRPYRPHSERPHYQGGDNRFQRPQGDRPHYQGGQSGEGRFQRPQGDRPPYQGGEGRFQRPQGDRPPYQGGEGRFQRPQGDRPPYQGGEGRFQRPQGDRPPHQGYRPQGGYPSSQARPPFRKEGMPIPDMKKAIPATKDYPTREAPPVKKSGDEEDKFVRKAPAAKEGANAKDVKTAKKPDSYRSFDARDRQGLRASDEEIWRKKKTFKIKSHAQEEVVRPKNLKVRLPISVKDLAAEMKLKASQLISKLFMQGVALTLNDLLDDETTVQLLGHEFECEITIDTAEEKRIQVTDKSIRDEIKESSDSQLHLRPPVVTFMGHVDHGKTSLIDAIRKSNRVAGEAGAITQHIGAFKCHTAVGDLTILDTPGHEAFSAMRTRGADVTDIVVLVVAGDEGMRAQTLEALNQAQQAKVPIVVAINKCDKPNFNADTVYRQLADQNLLPESWGGSTITVNCSAVTGTGVKDLLEMLALQAEVLELKANPESRARGTVIESEMHKGMGAVATILIQNGTLRIGDSIVFGQNYARIKTMHDEFAKELSFAGPSTPVKITGLSGLPVAGSEFVAVKDEKEARDISQKRTEGYKSNQLLQSKRGSLENLLQQKADKIETKVLNLIVKADVQGSLEALKTSLLKIPSSKVEICFISEGVGEVSESDIQFAATSKATIIGFHTKIESHAETLIKQLKVNVRLHDIIYHAVDDTKELMLGLLDKIAQENEIGKAEVKAVFKSSQLGNIAGCQVIDGIIRRNCIVRVMRGKEQVWKGPISSLKRVKEDVREVSKGIECGIVLQNFSDVKQGDVIHAIEVTYLTQELN